MSETAIEWKLHLQADPATVFDLLASNGGRARFWATSAPEEDGFVHFQFVNGARLRSRILRAEPGVLFELEYFEGSVVTFELRPDGRGGTDLQLTERGVAGDALERNRAGWVSVLLALKAAADFNVDLRNHDRQRTWDQGFVDN